MNELQCSDRKTHAEHAWQKTWFDNTVVEYWCQGAVDLLEVVTRMGRALNDRSIHDTTCPQSRTEWHSLEDCTCVWTAL